MKHLSLLYALLLCLSAFAHAGEITVTPTLDPIFHAAEQADDKTLFIFDVDDVLIVSLNQVFQAPYVQYVKPYQDHMKQHYSAKEYHRIWSILRQHFHTGIVDPKVLDLIAQIRKKQAKIIGLSSADAGDFGPIHHMEDLRLKELDQEHISFRSSFAHTSLICFTSLKSLAHHHRTPLFKHGVLFGCKVPKGEVLREFLSAVKWRPHKIIFTDDKMKHVESVRDFCQQAQIPFQGFQYTAVETLAHRQPFNSKRADLQFKILAEQEKWLSDSEADQVLRS